MTFVASLAGMMIIWGIGWAIGRLFFNKTDDEGNNTED